MSHNCKNCDGMLTAEFTYCPSCGQKAHLHRISMHEVAHEAIHYFTHADKGFFQLIRALLTRTGGVAREFVDGKRKKYFAPLTFFFLVAAIFVFLITFMSAEQAKKDIWQAHPELKSIKDSAQKVKAYQTYKRTAEAIGFVNKYSNVMAMVALPLITFIFWVFYLRGRYNYTEHLAAGMYMIGFINLSYILVFVPLSRYILPQYFRGVKLKV